MNKRKIVIGTRGSKLALWQANWVCGQLMQNRQDIDVKLNIIKTTGDKITDVALSKVGGKGLFVKEIEESLLRGESDIAVHSMKDVPALFPDGLTLSVICKREDPRDALVVNSSVNADSVENLPKGLKVGTSSLRRQCQLLNIRSDLDIQILRGNLDTRLRKVAEGEYGAAILATAGMKRLNCGSAIKEIISPKVMLPAVGQGAVGIETRVDDEFVLEHVMPLNHGPTHYCVAAERGFLLTLEGGCQVPIGAYAVIDDKTNEIVIDGLVGSVSGQRIIRGQRRGSVERAKEMGQELAREILDKGARVILDELYEKG